MHYRRKSTQKLQPPRADSPIQHSEVRRASDLTLKGSKDLGSFPSKQESPHKNCGLQGLKARFNIARFEGPRIIPQLPLHKRKRQRQVQPPRADSPIQHSEVRRASNHSLRGSKCLEPFSQRPVPRPLNNKWRPLQIAIVLCSPFLYTLCCSL